ncbi:MAG TPA: hypothetical protein VGG14_09315 [Candidatus Sulfotelmatobacter sp.]|jgi:hypothetical protein
MDRFYTIERMKGGMKFKCTHCSHHVSTLDFDPHNGNVRTQAAAAINRHAAKVHHEPLLFSSLDFQPSAWRTRSN